MLDFTWSALVSGSSQPKHDQQTNQPTNPPPDQPRPAYNHDVTPAAQGQLARRQDVDAQPRRCMDSPSCGPCSAGQPSGSRSTTCQGSCTYRPRPSAERAPAIAHVAGRKNEESRPATLCSTTRGLTKGARPRSRVPGQKQMVPRGLEPRTLRLLAVRSDQLSYETLALVSWPRATCDSPPLRAGEKRQAGAHKPYLNRFGPDRGPEPQSIEKKAR